MTVKADKQIINNSLGIGGTPTVGSAFDIQSTSLGSLPWPRMTTAQRDICSVVPGMTVYNTDTNKVNVYDGSSWQAIDAAAGAVNYITNSSAESNSISGYARYADAAAITPVDGTGGSPNAAFTFTVSPTSPLRGNYSFLITKDAANRQGHGVSYDFTIAATDKSRALGISWEGEASANYTGSSGTEYMVCYVYDVTNSVLIATQNINIAGGSLKGFTTFNATTSTSYRLIFHVAGTGTSAWTYKFDSLKISPEIVVQGFAGTDWQLYDPGSTGLNGFGTISAYGFYWKRVGPDLHIRGKFVAGTTTAAEARIPFPTGLVSASNLTLETAGKFDRNATSNTKGEIYREVGVSYFTMGRVDGALTAFTKQNANSLASSTDVIGFEASCPIVGWSSNVTMANRAVEEYASSNSTWGTSETALANNVNSIAGSVGGTSTPASTSFTLRVRFPSPIQATDKIFIEISGDRKKWSERGNYAGSVMIESARFDGTNYIGAGFNAPPAIATDVDIIFGKYPTGTSTAWTGTWYWRVRKVSGGASVGYPIGARNIVGDMTGTAIGTGLVGEPLSYVAGAVGTTGSTSYATLTTTDMTLALTPGNWTIFVGGGAYLNVTSGADVSGSVELFNATASTSLATCQDFLGVNVTGQYINSSFNMTVPIDVSVATTVRLRAKVSAGTAVIGVRTGTRITAIRR